MRAQNCLRQYWSVIDKLGCELVETKVTGSSHYKITVRFKGKTRFFITGSSPSDLRSLKNLKGDVTRWMREVS